MEENSHSEISDASDGGEKTDCRVSELVAFFKSVFQPDDFEKAAEMLRMREEKLKIAEEMKAKEMLKRQIEFEMQREDLERALESSRSLCNKLGEKNRESEQNYTGSISEHEKRVKEARERCDIMETKLVELDFKRIEAENELIKYKRMSEKVEEEKTRLEEDNRVLHGREQRLQEKVAALEEELKNKECEERERLIQMKVENTDLQCSKRKIESEIQDYKRRCGELEARVLQMEEENSVLHGRQKIEEKEEKGLCRTSTIQEKPHYAKEKEVETLNLSHTYDDDVGSACHSPDSGSSIRWVAGNAKDVNVDGSLATDETRGRRAKKQLVFKEEDRSGGTVAPAVIVGEQTNLGDVIMIIDSEDETDTTPIRNSKARHVELAGVSGCNLGKTIDNEKERTSWTGSKREQSDQRGEGAAKENSTGCEENFRSVATPKRKRPSRVITSDSEGEDYNIPIGRLRMKGLEEASKKVHECTDSPVNQSRDTPTVFSIGENVKKSGTPSRRHLVPLRLCKEKTSGAKGASSNHSAMEPKTDILLPEKITVENDSENEAEDGDSGSEGESLGGFIVEDSSGSEHEYGSIDSSEDEYTGNDLSDLLARIGRQKGSKKWEYEADMLSSFAKDPELCMKAVCALYRQQTSEEKSFKGSLYVNNRGFSKFDAFRGSLLAQFLTDGDPYGPLKKSVQELEKYDRKGLEYCHQLATRYSKQLFEIYQSKEDPHFHPH